MKHLPAGLRSQVEKQRGEQDAHDSRLIVRLGRYTLVHTSGSTGKPCNFLYNDSAITQVVANMVRLSLGGKAKIRLWDFPVRVLFVASVGRGYASTTLALNGIKKYNAKSLILNVQDPLESWPEKIQEFDPNYLAGYPSCIQIVADMQAKGSIHIRPKKVITGGEPITVERARYFQEVFGCDIIDYYACTESLALGAGASWYDGIYLFDDMNYCEVDEFGRLIVTVLYNEVFPLIRYRLNDVVLGFTRGPVGPLPYTRIDKVLGRSEDMMWFRNPAGKWDFLHPLFIDDLNVPGIKEFQFVQVNEISFRLRIVPEPGTNGESLTEKAREQVNAFLTRKNLSNVKFSVDLTDSLDVDKISGKVKLVVGALKPGSDF
ncbi:AMP-binding protein [Thermosediminibacter oceani]|uniref:AMP-binding protein n=1 Tax=Thermosediminibacter oceani TaxID=291990 RepID=UPI001CB7470D|nr:AMP-binding protein [Thermosediminibacter oceani]